MTTHVDVVAEFDDRSVMSSANDLKRSLERTGDESGRAFSSSLSREISGGLRGLNGMVADFGRSLRSGIDSEMRSTIPGLDAVSSKVSGIGTAGFGAVAGVAAIGVATAAVVKQLYSLGAQWDDIADSITVRTGRIGDELASLTSVVSDVANTTAASLGSIGDITGQLAQSMPRLAENNTAIRQMASNLAYLDANGQAVNIRELGKAFSAFNVNAADQIATFDQLNNVSQKTGIPINQLIQTVQQGAPQFKQFGLDMGESTGLMAAFEEGGLDSGKALTGLQIALKNLGGDARGAAPALADAIAQIKTLHDANQEGAAQQLAKDTFGAKTFAPFLDAIESGRVNVEGLNQALDDTGLSIRNMQALTDDGAQSWEKLTNHIQTAFKPAADGAFAAVNTAVSLFTGHLSDALSIFTGVDAKISEAKGHMEELAAVAITPESALGKMLLGGQGLPGATGAPQPVGVGSAQRSLAVPGPDGGFRVHGGGIFADPNAGTGRGGGAASAPVLPYDTSLPSGFANVPQTAAIVSAENSYMDARHTLAEKQALVHQLEQDNTHTEAEIQKARNDVINAQQAQQQAELRLYDARNTLYDKNNKQLQGYADQMGEFGAKLDQDLGISKGLSGIADNLVRFLGNLIAAPALAQLGAIANAPGQAQGGFGLIGMLGAQGAFGPQYTAAGQQAAAGTSAMSSAALQPGYSAAMAAPPGVANPGESARDFAHRVMMPFWQSQGLTVGDHGADQYGEHQHGALDIMVGNLAEGSRVLQQVLSDPNVYGAIFNNQTYGYGHGLTPQDYSAGHTGNPTQDHQDHVHAWYKPGDSGNITPATGPAGAPMPVIQASVAPAVAPFSGVPVPLPVTIVGGGGGGGFFGGAAAPGLPGAPAPGTPFAPGVATGIGDGSLPGPVPWGSPGIPAGIGGGGGQSPVWGASPQGPGLGGSALSGVAPMPGVGGTGGGPTQIGGLAPVGGTGKGGVGMTEGGLLDTALSAATTGLDLVAPGAGQAAQIGIKLANRAIKYGGQVAGIGAQGLMETFLPMGGSELAQKNWITRAIGGLAGAAPALPNMAGKAAAPPTPQQQGQGGGGAGGQGAPPINVTYNNHQATEDRAGADLTNHLSAMRESGMAGFSGAR